MHTVGFVGEKTSILPSQDRWQDLLHPSLGQNIKSLIPTNAIIDCRMGSNRVQRGGSWNNNAGKCRCATRNNWNPDKRNNNIGFRVALAPAQPSG